MNILFIHTNPYYQEINNLIIDIISNYKSDIDEVFERHYQDFRWGLSGALAESGAGSPSVQLRERRVAVGGNGQCGNSGARAIGMCWGLLWCGE